MEKLLAVLGCPGDEKCGAVVLMQDEDGKVYEALEGNPVSVDSLKAYLVQARGYVDNLHKALLLELILSFHDPR